MDRRAGQIGTDREVGPGPSRGAPPAGRLHPPSEPFDRRLLDRGDGHLVYVEQCGNPDGQPVIVLHGGPGGGCSPFMRRFFDPARYRAVLFDQRGCGRSHPAASVSANTTPHLVGDIAALCAALDLPPAILFGGSWGAALALAFAQAHPDAVAGLVLRGVFLGRRTELEWFYGGGAARFYPDLWDRFRAPIPEDERGDLIAAYHRRLFCGDPAREARYAAPWLLWENALAGLETGGGCHVAPDYARTFARLECHYFRNGCFLDDDQLLTGRDRIAHLPCTIVQGRYDMVCPPASAWALAEGWDRCTLTLVPASGHALSEPRIAAELVRVMEGWPA